MNLPDIDALIAKLVDAAINSDDKSFVLDTIKTLCPLYIANAKISGKKGEDEFEGVPISEMRARIAEADESRLVAGARRRAEGEDRPRDRNGKYA